MTENAVVADVGSARTAIDEIKALGISVALDDFGTGYSSLSCLRQFPFDRIKIDRSFVSNVTGDPENGKIVAGILALARNLGLSVTAEGIESDGDLGYLKTLDCPLGQGFLFNKPISADRVDWMLETVWSNLTAQELPWKDEMPDPGDASVAG